MNLSGSDVQILQMYSYGVNPFRVFSLRAKLYATIVDRKKDMIVTAGFKVYPAELERVLCMHSIVSLAAVGSIPDEAKGELAKAYVVLREGADVSEAELIEHCREHLAACKVPRAVQSVDRVPMTASGKIMRRMLATIDDGGRPPQAVAPHGRLRETA